MKDEAFELLDEIEDDHWWFIGKRALMEALLDGVPPGRVVDLGCGTGGVLRELEPRHQCFGIDRAGPALDVSARKGTLRLTQGDVAQLPFRDESFDTVVMLDVLEHLEDDVGFLRDVARVCRKDGLVLISVPAFQWLWSRHDETFHHFRRYDARSLRRCVEQAGLVPSRLTYTNVGVFPAAAAWRVLSRRLGLERFLPEHDFQYVPRWANGLLCALYRMEARWIRRWRAPFGLSVVCLAQRQGS